MPDDTRINVSDEARIDAFLADDYARIDRQLPEIMTLLNERRAGQSWHKHGTFRDHLFGTYRALTLWGQSREARLCGLFHSVYSNEYVDLALFDPAEGRDVLRQRLGHETEALIHRFCVIPRTAFVLDLLERERIPPDGLTLNDQKGETVRLDRREIGIYLVVTVADFVEQWYSWQEDTMSGYPHFAPVDARLMWSAALWPGQFRPGSTGLALASRLARHLPDLDLPTPPIFEHCSRTLSRDDEIAASALYWDVVSQRTPLVSPVHAERSLSRAAEFNPFVAEPRLLLAQLALLQGDFDTALGHAEQGLRLASAWGLSWDKRIPWQGWIVWARLLRQRAQKRIWPRTLPEHNNLGLVTAEAD